MPQPLAPGEGEPPPSLAAISAVSPESRGWTWWVLSEEGGGRSESKDPLLRCSGALTSGSYDLRFSGLLAGGGPPPPPGMSPSAAPDTSGHWLCN